MTPTCYLCRDCDLWHCLECEPPGTCKECRRPLCVICFMQSHNSDRRGLCLACEWIEHGDPSAEDRTHHERLLRLTQEEVNRLAFWHESRDYQTGKKGGRAR